MRKLLFLFALCLPGLGLGKETFKEKEITLEVAGDEIYGTLTVPKKQKKNIVALIIAGSGPTDRNGNNPFMTNNSLKYLAYGLADNSIASLRFDKRGIAASADAMESEADLTFDTYISDVREWIALLRDKLKYENVVIVGHSEGSLIGLCANENADKLVSIAGTAESADVILKKQLSQMSTVKGDSYAIIDSLKQGYTVSNVPSGLLAVFRPSVQPYIISWFRYDPGKIMRNVEIPVLILHGTKDLQVEVVEAEALHQANDQSELVIIPNMNHVLKIIDSDEQSENIKAYNDAEKPISTELVKAISDFILK